MQSLKELKINKSVPLSEKGKKGFRKVHNPKDEVFQIRINNEVKKFMTEYCQKHGITKTQLLMGALQYYTGFNGDNADEILKQN